MKRFYSLGNALKVSQIFAEQQKASYGTDGISSCEF